MSKPDQGRPSTPPDDPLAVPDTLFNRLDGWTWLGCYGGYYLQADLLHLAGFEHGFFTRRWQGRQPDELACYLSAGTSIHRPQQVHGSEILEASQADGPPWPEADGLVSNRGGQSLWVCGADCTPVLIADPGTGHAAACHAGWRGLAAGILPKAVEKLEALGADRNKLLIALGPAVSGSNYQVGIEVAEAVARSLHVDDSKAEISSAELHDRLCALQSAGALSKSPTPQTSTQPGSSQPSSSQPGSSQPGSTQPGSSQPKLQLDIRLAAKEQMLRLGIDQTQISCCPLCTVAEPTLFHSWRRDQVKAVQWSGIVAQADEEPATS